MWHSDWGVTVRQDTRVPLSTTLLSPNWSPDSTTRSSVSVSLYSIYPLSTRDCQILNTQKISMYFYSLWTIATLVAVIESSHAFSPLRTPLRARGSSSCRSTQKMFVADMLSMTDVLSITQPATSLLIAEGEVYTFDFIEPYNHFRYNSFNQCTHLLSSLLFLVTSLTTTDGIF